MSKYIEAEWLKELYKPYENYNGKELSVPIGAILANIEDAPSIDIVHCRECKRWECARWQYGICAVWGHRVREDFYCGFGEREGE